MNSPTHHNVTSIHPVPSGGSSPPAAPAMAPLHIDLDKEKVRSFLAEGDEVTGDLRCSTGICVAGTVRGSVHCETGAIVIEKSGHVTGSLSGTEKILIDGRVNCADGQQTGSVQITTPGLVALFNHAIVNADIEYGKLATYDDMTHNGRCRKMGVSG